MLLVSLFNCKVSTGKMSVKIGLLTLLRVLYFSICLSVFSLQEQSEIMVRY